MMTRRCGVSVRSFASAAGAKKPAAINRVRGTRDFLPEDAERHREVVQVLQDIVQRYGFRQIQTPLLEYTDLFSRSLGDGSDIVMKEMYTFTDNSGKSVTLRPEGTAGVMRALISNNLPVSPPQKLFYHGSMFRYERPQRGRYREFQQFGAEFIGSTGASVDVEVIGMAAHALESLGIKSKTSLHINSLGDTESRARYRVALEEFFTQYKQDLSADSVSRLERGSVLRILDSKSETDQTIIQDAPRLKQFLSTESLERFDSVLNGLAALGVTYEENSRLVRGLDYYSHTVFEFVEQVERSADDDEDSKSGIAVLAGGCYDGLTELLGGASIPCIGWAAGVDRLGLLRDSNESSASTIAIVPVVSGADGDAVLFKSLQIAHTLRQSGHVVHFCHGKGNLKKQMKTADRYGSAYAVIVGGDEVAKQQVKIKNLKERREEEVAWDALSAYRFE
ncbi:hypothetical protein Poli38472_000681 [Pythium oligandrum]|uniref:histidine--tRNA ligase n=1 Tax=Pythium oligandrum TaxID=41045 RepID=A0A8K1CC31_PYTOL|nr:hypothetical protein Poli38472_000681 [Pythium oligandrum]|eukprot:TMW60639.1 hypothetical protein Poli38472_000681 [Pythium oligandrum]